MKKLCYVFLMIILIPTMAFAAGWRMNADGVMEPSAGADTPIKAGSVSAVGTDTTAPAAVTSFAGTVSAASRTATFSDAADWALAKVGSTLIADSDTRIVVAIGTSPTVTVDIDTTWAGSTAITSLQEPIAQIIQADGTVVGYINALGGIGFLGGTGSQKGVAFGDGDSGIYESISGTITYRNDGLSRHYEDSYGLFSSKSSGYGLLYENPTNDNPSIIQDKNDKDTGLGRKTLDQPSWIAGGVEAIRSIEANGIIYNVLNAVQQESITDGSTTAASAVISKASENFDSTCAVGDTVLIWGGTTTADYGVYSISEVTSATQLTLNSVLSTTNTNVDFYVFRGGTIATGSALYVDGDNVPDQINREFSTLDLTTDTTVTEAQILANKFISNQAATGEVDVKLPAVSYRIVLVFDNSEVQIIEVNPPSGEVPMLNGDLLDADDCVDSPATVGSNMTALRSQAADGSWFWHFISSTGDWVDTGATD